MNARHGVQLGLFGSQSAACKWIQRQQADESLVFYTRYRLKERGNIGRPEYYFHAVGAELFKKGNERHEVYVTEALSLYWEDTESLLRGQEVDQQVLADAEFTIAGRRYALELDTGKMTMKQIRKRLKKYADAKFQGAILFVTLKRDIRVNNVLERASALVKDRLWVASFADVYADPYGPVWKTVDGTTRTVMKPGE